MATARAKATRKKVGAKAAASRRATPRKAAAPKKRASARRDEGPEQLFVDAVREHDFKAKDAADAWAKTKFVTLMLAWLVGEAPTARGVVALGSLLDHVRDELAPDDRESADVARAILVRATRGTLAVRNRAAFELAELRDLAVAARRPSLAAFIDALAHAAEAFASHADGDDQTPLRRGIEVGRSLLFTLAERRKGDGEDRAARAAVSRELAGELRRSLPAGP